MDRISKEEIEKWRDKIKKVINEVKPVDKKAEEMLKNMKAYVSDSKFFEEKGDLVRSFESIIWAWSIYEICQELFLFRR